jgi:hypothetical protein
MSRLFSAAFAALVGLYPVLCFAQPEPAEPTDSPEEPGEGDPEAGEGDDPEVGPDGEPLPGQPNPREKRPHIEEPDEDEGPEPPLIVPAPDQLSGHFSLSVSGLVAFPFGNLEAESPQTDAMGPGLGFGGDLGYGLSRMVAVGVWGQFLRLGDADACRDCKTSTSAFGAFVRYHLVQGTRFDPWMSAGLGYRSTKIETPGFGSTTYNGIEWLRVQVGGDWYAFKNVGFGPFLELDMGRYSTRSPGELGEQANHWQFLLGARVTLDIPGK